jgi:hypothetical protein
VGEIVVKTIQCTRTLCNFATHDSSPFDSSVFGSFDALVECCAIGRRGFLLAQEFCKKSDLRSGVVAEEFADAARASRLIALSSHEPAEFAFGLELKDRGLGASSLSVTAPAAAAKPVVIGRTPFTRALPLERPRPRRFSDRGKY